MKKRLAGLLVLILALSLVAASGCGGRDSVVENVGGGGTSNAGNDSDDNSSGQIKSDIKAKITMAHWVGIGAMEKASVNTVLKQLKKDYPNIDVEVNFVSGDYSTKMYANLAAGKEPDVFMVEDGVFGNWVKAGVLEDLTPYVEKSTELDTSAIWESAISRYTYDGQKQGSGDLYVIPKDISPRALYYNKDLLKKYGVEEPSKTTPMTYEEFVDFLKKLTHAEDDVWGIPQISWECFTRSAGTSLLSSDYKSSNLDDPKLIREFQNMADLIQVHKVTPPSATLSSEGALIMFQTGKAACFDGAIYNLMSVMDFDFDWAVCPLPGETEDPYASGYTGSVGYAVSKNSENKEAAYIVAEYFATRTGQEILCNMGFNVPLYKDMAPSEVTTKKGTKVSMEVFMQAAEHQQPVDIAFTDNDQWYTVLATRLQPLWNDAGTKASKLLPSIKAEIDSLLKQ